MTTTIGFDHDRPRNGRRRRLLKCSVLDSLYWRSCLAPKLGNTVIEHYPSHFYNALATYLGRSTVTLDDTMEIRSSHKASPIVSLDMDLNESRFLLSAGARDCTISVFDLSNSGSDGIHTHSFRPVAQSCKVTRDTYAQQGHAAFVPHGHSYSPTNVKWYPSDSGAFISTDSAGNVFIWDTNTFTPVFVTNVVSSGKSSHSHVAIDAIALPFDCTRSHSLAALGCRSTDNTSRFDDNLIRILDIKTGSIVQQLTGHVGGGGVATLQYFPLHDFILASGGADGTIRFWDIRKAGKGALLQTLDRSCSHDASQQDHHVHKGIPTQELWTCSSPSSSLSAYNPRLSHVQSHGGPVTSIRFTPDGCYLLSASTFDRTLQLWDVRPGTAQGAIALHTSFLGITDDPHQYSPYTLPKSQTRVSLLVTQPGSRQTTTVWVCGFPTGEIIGYNVHGQGCPEKVLQGHLSTALCMTEQHNSMRLFSGDSLGMILGWGHTSHN